MVASGAVGASGGSAGGDGMVGRRGFIGQLLAVLAGASMAPKGLLWQPQDDPARWPVLADDAVVSLEQMTRLFAQQLERRMPLEAVWQRSAGEYRIGDDAVYAPVRFDQALGIDVALPVDVGEGGFSQRVVVDCADQMADRIIQATRKRGAPVVFGQQGLPPGVHAGCRVSGPRVSVRGLQDYDLWMGAHLVRFDVLYGVAR